MQNADSPTYDFTTPYLHGTEEICIALELCANFTKITTGMNITQGSSADAIARRIFKDMALTAYAARVDHLVSERFQTDRQNARVAEDGNTPAIVQACVDAIARHTNTDDVAAGI